MEMGVWSSMGSGSPGLKSHPYTLPGGDVVRRAKPNVGTLERLQMWFEIGKMGRYGGHALFACRIPRWRAFASQRLLQTQRGGCCANYEVKFRRLKTGTAFPRTPRRGGWDHGWLFASPALKTPGVLSGGYFLIPWWRRCKNGFAGGGGRGKKKFLPDRADLVLVSSGGQMQCVWQSHQLPTHDLAGRLNSQHLNRRKNCKLHCRVEGSKLVPPWFRHGASTIFLSLGLRAHFPKLEGGGTFWQEEDFTIKPPEG